MYANFTNVFERQTKILIIIALLLKRAWALNKVTTNIAHKCLGKIFCKKEQHCKISFQSKIWNRKNFNNFCEKDPWLTENSCVMKLNTIPEL